MNGYTQLDGEYRCWDDSTGLMTLESDSSNEEDFDLEHGPGEAKIEPPNGKIFEILPEDDAHLRPSEVLKQRKFTGHYTVPSSLASTSCLSLGISGLSDTLNDVLGTNYTLDDPTVAFLLNMCLEREYDFGTSYAYLRPRWKNQDWDLQGCEENDHKYRIQATDDKNQITKPNIPPRRVWDLYSNRVIPYWAAADQEMHHLWVPVSHAWMSPDRRNFVDTDINLHEWPVPIPIDTSLDRIRIELLNEGLEYAWLDVLCLRQVGPPENEDIRKQEWLLDVPTIGTVYRGSTIYTYYNGLGRPFEIRDLESDRHWLNRAWTLQEVSAINTTVGITEKSADPKNTEQDPLVETFYEKLEALREPRVLNNIFHYLDAMRQRQATSELDKISGLAYLLQSQILPGYISGQDPEVAWGRLVDTMSGPYRTQMLFRFPVPGDGQCSWRPSWQQANKLQLPQDKLIFTEDVGYNGEDIYTLKSFVIDQAHCRVEGLADKELELGREGWISLTAEGMRAMIPINASHSHPIPDDSYTLISCRNLQFWVVGKEISGMFKKISVVETSYLPHWRPTSDEDRTLIPPGVLRRWARNSLKASDVYEYEPLMEVFIKEREVVLA